MTRVFTSVTDWRDVRRGPDWTGREVGFVPTMGALHAGHEALLARARRENELVVLSVFVNPTQFNDPQDLACYPRTLNADVAMASPFVDAVLAPSAEELYLDRYHYRVTENELSRRWEGEHRPGHFDGVLTVVLKMLNLVQPRRAYFGEKDWQQLQLVRGMVEAFLLPVAIVPCATVRDDDGLALSSRNRRLSPTARTRAAGFPRVLRAAPDCATAIESLRREGFEVDYVDEADGVRLGAVRLEGVRLIDNVRVGAPSGVGIPSTSSRQALPQIASGSDSAAAPRQARGPEPAERGSRSHG